MKRSSVGLVLLSCVCIATVLCVFRYSPGSFTNSVTILDPSNHFKSPYVYLPSKLEQYILDHSIELGLDDTDATATSPQASCNIIRETTLRHLNVSSQLDIETNVMSVYLKELEQYNSRVLKVIEKPLPDVRKRLQSNEPNGDVCKKLLLHPDGLQGIFENTSGYNFNHVLSYSNRHGFSEPLLPPFRHPDICVSWGENHMRLDYLIHDFYAMCLSIKPHSRFVFVDMGASLSFHGTEMHTAPAFYLTSLYSAFGFPFDHIYAYEVSATDPLSVFKKLPDSMRAAYHWINIGVSANDSDSVTNPLHMILDSYEESDMIIVKLDIDTPSIELPLAKQLLENEGKYLNLVDHFYFEHHVHMTEAILGKSWIEGVSGSIHESLQLFVQLRKNGIMAHYWV